MKEEEGYLRDLGKVVPSIDGKWDNRREYERLSIVYVEENDDSSQQNNNSNNNNSNNNNSNNNNDNNNNNQNSGNNENNNNNNNGNNGNNGGNTNPQPETQKYTVVVNVNLSFDNCTINGISGTVLEVNEGSNVSIVVSKAGYVNKTQNINNISKNETVNIIFTDEDRIKLTIRTVTNISAWDVNIVNDQGNLIEKVNGHEFQVDYGSSVNVEIIGKDFAYGRFARVTRLTNITEDKQIVEQYLDSKEDGVVDAHLTSIDKVNWYYAQAIVLGANLTDGEWRNIYVRNALNGQIWFENLRNGDPDIGNGVETDLEFRVQTIDGEKVIQYKGTYVRNPSTQLTYPYSETIAYINPVMYNSENVQQYIDDVNKYNEKYGTDGISPATVAFLISGEHYNGNRRIIP
jgi:hypothetical protein